MLRRECRFARDAGENVFANRNVGKNLSAARVRKTVKTRLTLRRTGIDTWWPVATVIRLPVARVGHVRFVHRAALHL